MLQQAANVALGFTSGGLGTKVPPLFHGSAYPELIGGRFDPARMLSGEGYHGEGAGLYASEAPRVADWYRESYGQYSPQDVQGAKDALVQQYPPGSTWSTSSGQSHLFTGTPENYQQWMSKIGWSNPDPSDWVRVAQRYADYQPTTKPGAAYELSYPGAETEQFLSWRQPLAQQSDYVKTALKRLGIDENKDVPPDWVDETEWGSSMGTPKMGELNGEQIYQYLGTKYGSWLTNHNISPSGDPAAASVLRLNGIRGTRYPAADLPGNEGKFNYSIFSPDAVNIVRKYAVPGLLTGGSAGALYGAQQGGQ